MKITKLFAAIAFLGVFAVAGCDKQSESEKQAAVEAERMRGAGYSFTELEQSRATAQANALFNARTYFAANPRFAEGSSIVPHTDSTIGPKCRNGDGWATLSVMKVEHGTDGTGKPTKNIDKTVLKCSTVSPTLGCYTTADFDKKPDLKNADGSCQPETVVPYPLPKIVAN